MTLRSFVDEIGPPTYPFAVVGTESAGPLQSMLADAFESQQITVESLPDLDRRSDLAVECDLESVRRTDEDAVVLLEDETVVAASPMSGVYDAFLAINSDLYMTGGRGLGDIQLPDVLARLDDSRFTLRGYPLAHKEKLLLIVVSRYIEQLAWEAGAGTLRSSFQYLSRIDDEAGTRAVYNSLAATELALHVYGVPDSVPGDLECTVHGGDDDDYRNAWFVVFRSESAGNGDDGNANAALLALETESRIWDGFWTEDPERVARIDDYIETTL